MISRSWARQLYTRGLIRSNQAKCKYHRPVRKLWKSLIYMHYEFIRSLHRLNIFGSKYQHMLLCECIREGITNKSFGTLQLNKLITGWLSVPWRWLMYQWLRVQFPLYVHEVSECFHALCRFSTTTSPYQEKLLSVLHCISVTFIVVREVLAEQTAMVVSELIPTILNIDGAWNKNSFIHSYNK